MDYHTVKCPSCGSNAIVPAENERVYCKSCDSLFEKEDATAESTRTVEITRSGLTGGDKVFVTVMTLLSLAFAFAIFVN